MCGIAVILKNITGKATLGQLAVMTSEVEHRGPDDRGLWIERPDGTWATPEFDKLTAGDGNWIIGLGFQRLSIIDLSAAGHQPMGYQNRFWIVYNGQVYNYIELRSELKQLGHTFKSTSDTEVILAAYAEWGTDCFARFRGMWGLVIFDTVTREIVLSRDRLGIKPLYMWQGERMIGIASEIKQFQHLPGFKFRMNSGVVSEYLKTGYEDLKKSFFQGIQPVPPGTWMRILLDKPQISQPEAYWYPERIRESITHPEEASRLFTEKLLESVRIHLRSDIPVGCALSGGLDSSSIAVLVDKINQGAGEPLHTFTSTFPGDLWDEREYVDVVVKEINAQPHFVTPNPTRFLQDMDRFLWVHDEPVGSLSMYASYCIAGLTREAGISVSLNGQGGDEILSGYWQTYFLYLRLLLINGQTIPMLQHLGGALTSSGNADLIGQLPVMAKRYRIRRKSSPFISLRIPLAQNGPNLLDDILELDEHSRRIYEIRTMFLPRLLKWDDRNSMAFSVEGRYPFLDHELIELCLSFSANVLYYRGWTKWPLRLGLERTLPARITQRRSKFGFEVPQDRWMRGPLRPYIENWLKQDRPAWDYVNRESVIKLAEKTWKPNQKQEEPGQALFRTIVFDHWLKLFGVVP